MREAIRLSWEMMSTGKAGPFGAIVVREGEIIGRGWNQAVASSDPTAHAEIVAIRDASRRLSDHRLSGCELYASCEPCPMCLGAIFWARLDRVWFGATRQDAAKAGFDDAFFYRELELAPSLRRVPAAQLLRDEAVKSLEEWTKNPDKTPY